MHFRSSHFERGLPFRLERFEAISKSKPGILFRNGYFLKPGHLSIHRHHLSFAPKAYPGGAREAREHARAMASFLEELKRRGVFHPESVFFVYKAGPAYAVGSVQKKLSAFEGKRFGAENEPVLKRVFQSLGKLAEYGFWRNYGHSEMIDLDIHPATGYFMDIPYSNFGFEKKGRAAKGYMIDLGLFHKAPPSAEELREAIAKLRRIPGK